ncbi:MAG: Rrf2 family transcriptional regulator [Planctomycetes bacterium]|nr:Rrf2 family transcriptional regulator [Planctomycetota bacterium]
MKFTQETDYAFRLIQHLVAADPTQYFTAADMSARECIPYRFLLRVLAKLKKAGIIASRQGIDGGFRLARPAGSITLREVVEAVEGGIHLNRCLKDVRLCGAGHAPACRIHRTLAAVQARLLEDLDRYTFASLESS